MRKLNYNYQLGDKVVIPKGISWQVNEVAGEYIQIDLGEKDDKNAEGENLLFRGRFDHGFHGLSVRVCIHSNGKNR